MKTFALIFILITFVKRNDGSDTGNLSDAFDYITESVKSSNQVHMENMSTRLTLIAPKIPSICLLMDENKLMRFKAS